MDQEVRYLPPSGQAHTVRIPKFPWLAPVIALLYGVSPVDLIPDLIPILGLGDDIGVVIVCLALILRWGLRRKKALSGNQVSSRQ